MLRSPLPPRKAEAVPSARAAAQRHKISSRALGPTKRRPAYSEMSWDRLKGWPLGPQQLGWSLGQHLVPEAQVSNTEIQQQQASSEPQWEPSRQVFPGPGGVGPGLGPAFLVG